MSGPIVVSKYGPLMYPGVKLAYDNTMAGPAEYKMFYKEESSDLPYERVVGSNGFNVLPVLGENEAIKYQSSEVNFVKDFVPVKIGGGFIISREAIKFNKYMSLSAENAKRLAIAKMRTNEYAGIKIIDDGATSGKSLTADGLCLFNEAHLLGKGGTQSNMLSTAEDLSESCLENMIHGIDNFLNDEGMPMGTVKANKLLVHVDQRHEVARLLENANRPATADRDINAIYQQGDLPGGVILSHYMVDRDATVIITDHDQGFKVFTIWDDGISQDTDFETDGVRFKISHYRSFGVVDHRCVYYSAGAA